jgi:hypothetical protein
MLNAYIIRQPRDRINGRFWQSSEDFRQLLNALTEADQDHLSDGDYVAVLQEIDGKPVVRLALVEGMLEPSAKDRKHLESTHRLDITNPDGRLQLQLLDRCGKGA